MARRFSWVTEGAVIDTSTGKHYVLEGVNFDEEPNTPCGNGLALRIERKDDTEIATIQKVESEDFNGLRRVLISLEAVLQDYILEQ